MSRVSRVALAVLVPLWALAGVGVWVLSGDPVQGAVSAGLGLSIGLLAVALLSQGGRPQLSPQRAAALATGHQDRRTVFERPYIRKPMWILLALSHRLAVPRLKASIRRALVTSGNPELYTPEEYLATSIAAGLTAFALIEAVWVSFSGEVSYLFGGLALVGGFALSLYQLHDQAGRRLATISRRIPYSLDLIALAMGAGANFAEAVETIVAEDSEDPFNVELRTMLAEMDLGTPRRQALENLARRVPIDSLQSIVASVIQSEQLGTSMSEVLHDQATLLRLHRSARAENKAAIASVRILLPCLVLVIAVVLAIFGPVIIKVMREGLF
jgi:tight adherence protein C